MPHKACFKSCAIATPKINFFHLELGFWDEIPINRDEKLSVPQNFDCSITFFYCFLNNETIFSLALSGEKLFVSL